MQDNDLEGLEIRLDFQEKTLLDLNDVIVKQQNEIDELRNSYRQLHQLMNDWSDTAHSQVDESPPHY